MEHPENSFDFHVKFEYGRVAGTVARQRLAFIEDMLEARSNMYLALSETTACRVIFSASDSPKMDALWLIYFVDPFDPNSLSFKLISSITTAPIWYMCLSSTPRGSRATAESGMLSLYYSKHFTQILMSYADISCNKQVLRKKFADLVERTRAGNFSPQYPKYLNSRCTLL